MAAADLGCAIRAVTSFTVGARKEAVATAAHPAPRLAGLLVLLAGPRR